MPGELIRDVGLTTFIVGGFLLFAISWARYLDPLQENEKVRTLVDLLDIFNWGQADDSRCRSRPTWDGC